MCMCSGSGAGWCKSARGRAAGVCSGDDKVSCCHVGVKTRIVRFCQFFSSGKWREEEEGGGGS